MLLSKEAEATNRMSGLKKAKEKSLSEQTIRDRAVLLFHRTLNSSLAILENAFSVVFLLFFVVDFFYSCFSSSSFYLFSFPSS